MLQQIKDSWLQARKNRDSVQANLLGTVFSDIKLKAKDDGDREPTDKDAQKIVDKFLKQNALALESLNTEQLTREREILLSFAALVPTVMIDYDAVIAKIIADNPDKWEAAKAKQQSINFFLGQAMKATQGAADVVIVNQKLSEALHA